MLLPRSETLQRYPHHGPTSEKMGIMVYGTQKDGYGRWLYKVPRSEHVRVKQLGYQIHKEGTSYIYVSL